MKISNYLKIEVISLKDEISKLKSNLNKLNLENDGNIEQIRVLKDLLSKKEKDIKDYISELDQYEKESKFMDQEIKNKNKEINVLRDNNYKTSKDAEKLCNKNKELLNEIEKYKNKIHDLEDKIRIKGLDNIGSSLKDCKKFLHRYDESDNEYKPDKDDKENEESNEQSEQNIDKCDKFKNSSFGRTRIIQDNKEQVNKDNVVVTTKTTQIRLKRKNK